MGEVFHGAGDHKAGVGQVESLAEGAWEVEGLASMFPCYLVCEGARRGQGVAENSDSARSRDVQYP